MPSRSALRWNARAGRYQDRRGRFVPPSVVRADLDHALDQSSRTIMQLSEQLQRGQIDLVEWEVRMRAEVKVVQHYSAAVAKGGIAQLTQADLGRVGAATREQYRYLRRFALQIEAGLPLDGRFLARAGMYGQAGRRMYHLVQRDTLIAAGYTEERNRRYPGDSCGGCLDATAAGWVPIGALTPVGERHCLTRCRCDVQYRKAVARRSARRAA